MTAGWSWSFFLAKNSEGGGEHQLGGGEHLGGGGGTFPLFTPPAYAPAGPVVRVCQ